MHRLCIICKGSRLLCERMTCPLCNAETPPVKADNWFRQRFLECCQKCRQLIVNQVNSLIIFNKGLKDGKERNLKPEHNVKG